MLRETGTPGDRKLSLFDRSTDRRLEHDVLAQHPDIGAELAARLREVDEVRGATNPVPRNVSVEVEEGLRALGYVE